MKTHYKTIFSISVEIVGLINFFRQKFYFLESHLEKKIEVKTIQVQLI